jgi:hypothetical protein
MPAGFSERLRALPIVRPVRATLQAPRAPKRLIPKMFEVAA